MKTMERGRVPWVWPGAVLIAAVATGGCATDVPRRVADGGVTVAAIDDPRRFGDAGASSARLFASPMVEREHGSGWEVGRSDDRLSARPAQALSAADEWPEPPRASLERRRSLRIADTPTTGVFYLEERRGGVRRGDWTAAARGWWWGG